MNESAYKIQPGSVCRVPYELGGFGGKLMSDLAREGSYAEQLFFPRQSWREVVARIETRTSYPRAELSHTLEQRATELGAPETSLKNSRKLAQKNTFAIVTGQQAGFLGGPLYSLYKALTAIKLAREYENEANGAAKFVPVFWVAGDDHDLAEIDHTHFLSADGRVVRVGAPLDGDYRGRSACDVFLTRNEMERGRVSKELQPYLNDGFLNAILKNYEGRSFESAFAQVLLQWLGAEGIVVALSSDLRKFAGGILARDVAEFERHADAVRRAGEAMGAAGYEPGFSESLRIAPHFFVAQTPLRIRTPINVDRRDGERRFTAIDAFEQPLTADQLRDRVLREPELFSASAALRPIVQQIVFPCVATVLGPGEVAYWAQLREMHAHYGAVWPVIVPRATLTLVDAAGEKAARKLGLAETPQEIFRSKDEMVGRIIHDGKLSAKLTSQRNEMLAKFDAMRIEIQAAGAGVDSMLDKVRAKLNFQLSRVLDRAVRAVDQRGEAKVARAAYLSALVRPKNSPQERVLCAAQFMAKYPDLPRRLLEIIEPDIREHLIVTL